MAPCPQLGPEDRTILTKPLDEITLSTTQHSWAGSCRAGVTQLCFSQFSVMLGSPHGKYDCSSEGDIN